MKAAITDGKGRVWIDPDVPMPEPGPYHCLCRIDACATCTGTDRKHIVDKLPWSPQEYPGILGHESVGTVTEVGEKVRNLKVGDRVLRATCVYPGEKLGDYISLWGCFAEYGLALDRTAWLEDNPDTEPNGFSLFQQVVPADLDISAADATMLITLKEAASYVANVGVGMCKSLAILGSGAVALSMCRFAKLFGADPVIVAGRRQGPLDHATRLGADATVNSAEQDVVEAVRELTGGEGVDVVIDTTGDGAFLTACLPALKPDGKAAAYATYPPSDAARKEIAEDRLIAARPAEDLAHPYLCDAVRMGVVDLSEFYSSRMPLDQIAEGFARIEEKKDFKIAFEMHG